MTCSPSRAAPSASSRPPDDAWISFTSGSTEAPKAVAASAAAFVEAETHLWSVRSEDRVLAGLSVGFDASCEEMWLAWRNGAALVPAPPALVRPAGELGRWLAEQRISVVSTVPTLAAMWDLADLQGVRLLILGGEACPESLAWRLAAGIGGVGLARYLDPELDAGRFAALPALGWERAYRTGDIVSETVDGLAFVGCRDDHLA